MNIPNKRGLWLANDGRYAVVLGGRKGRGGEGCLVAIIDPEFEHARLYDGTDKEKLQGEWELLSGQ